jgi:hypothetical protein
VITSAVGEQTGPAIAWSLIFPWIAAWVGAWLLAAWVGVYRRAEGRGGQEAHVAQF